MADSFTIAVHVTPRASRDEVLGVRLLDEGAREVEVRVTAAPDKGAANKAVCKLLAKELGVPKTQVCVKRGESSRHKLIEVPSSPSVNNWIETLPSL